MREKELRLALVCYGGISLAVYMHGITKELWRLARASRAFHAGEPAPTVIDGSEAVYHGLLQRIAAEGDLKLMVLIDVIAGASAGGLNGLFLGQAIATGQSLEPLTKLWLENADVEQLIDPDARPLTRLTRLWALPIAWMLTRRRGSTVERTVAPETRAEVRRKLSLFVRARWFHPPFGGKTFTRLILDAFEAMSAQPAGSPLLPRRQPIDLSVTATDFHGHRQHLALHSPAIAEEREHRLTIGFSDHGRTDRVLGDIAALTFAGRATASFPGAFPPFTVTEIDDVLAERKRKWPDRAAFLANLLQVGETRRAEDVVLIDGSVLANAPFRPAIDALRNRPARREVDRRFVYIDPTLGNPIIAGKLSGEKPGFVATIFGALSTIPREQPIHDNLEAIEARSRRIEQTKHIIAAIRGEVNEAVESTMGNVLLLYRPSTDRVRSWRLRSHELAAKQAGFAYAGYIHLKLATIGDDLTDMIAQLGGFDEPAELRMIRAAVGTQIRALGDDTTADPVIDFLKAHDLGYRIRRLRFLADRLTDIEASGESEPKAIEAARTAIYESLAPYLDMQMRDHYPSPVAGAARGAIGDIATAIAAIGSFRAIETIDDATDQRIAAALPRLSRGDRKTLLLAYLGFTFYDLATLSLLRPQGAQEFHAIKVDRISPDDAGSIRKGGAAATLRGVEFNCFGAFFSRAYRENDYLWGRLHGAERMIDLIVSTLPDATIIPAEEIADIKRALFHAVITEERGRLADPLLDALAAEIG
ncbi:patatin-like protein [Sphingomonas montanisoli]|uniref:Patatin-like protein n=1 Tax=Sphingomonas montanisoli TaxID=2606412 RepID=A0A5D9C6Z9_9SPHN|nr:patatin-like protein [Sphingomonas montanisoli]TZG27618.1 patatin-like protein [Sphingomonas montanisoli]